MYSGKFFFPLRTTGNHIITSVEAMMEGSTGLP